MSGIRAGVAAGMHVVGLAIRNPEQVLKDAGTSLLIKDYGNLKLWNILHELEPSIAEKHDA